MTSLIIRENTHASVFPVRLFSRRPLLPAMSLHDSYHAPHPPCRAETHPACPRGCPAAAMISQEQSSAAAFFPARFRRYDASPTQVRDKTETPCRPLSFPPNFKSSRALNHRQSDFQEVSVLQPCLPAMKVSREIILVGHNFSFLGVKIRNYWR